uniref:Uncharacterized protein n=1 Tax=Tanacetum cinerariifolium TaxID=118510 RepID=A0A6L2NS87_TANCI|nr:hypothetical protein [Tanacetum cinerariifolium]
MATLQFADTHNMVAFLSKPTKSDGFEQIVDFLNAHPIRYALTVNPTIYISCIKQFLTTALAKTINGEAQLHAKVDDKKIIVIESSIKRDLRLADEEGIDCLPNCTIFKQIAMMGKPTRNDTQVPQPSGPIESIADEAVHEELGERLVRDATIASCLEAEHDNEQTKTTQKKEIASQHDKIASLKRRVKKLEKRNRSRTHRLKRLYKVSLMARVESSDNEERLGEDASKQGRMINVIDVDGKITLVSVHDEVVSNDANKEMFDVDVLGCEEVFVAGQNENVVEEVVNAAQVSTATTTVTITTKEITLAQALKALKTLKPKMKGIIFQEPEEPVKPKKKDQIRLDKEAAKKLQAEFDEEERLVREKAKKEERANIALIEEWDDIQAKIDDDHQAEEKRNKPPTKTQQRNIMCTYLKNMEGYTLKDLKLREFDSIKEMFDRAFKRVNTFEDFRTELVKEKEKRAGEKLVQEITKKQKVEDDKEKVELKQLMETIPDEEEVAIDVIPLAVKSPRIVDWKIHKEGKKSYYQIVGADEKSQMYMIFSQMLKSFDREDLEDLYKLVKSRYGSTRAVESMDYLLWSDMKIMFKPHVEDEVWKLQKGYKVLEWKLYDFCGVHSLMMQSMQIYMLVEKKHPFTPPTLSLMQEKKLIIDYESKIAYQLLKLIKKQLKN